MIEFANTDSQEIEMINQLFSDESMKAHSLEVNNLSKVSIKPMNGEELSKKYGKKINIGTLILKEDDQLSFFGGME